MGSKEIAIELVVQEGCDRGFVSSWWRALQFKQSGLLSMYSLNDNYESYSVTSIHSFLVTNCI